MRMVSAGQAWWMTRDNDRRGRRLAAVLGLVVGLLGLVGACTPLEKLPTEW